MEMPFEETGDIAKAIHAQRLAALEDRMAKLEQALAMREQTESVLIHSAESAKQYGAALSGSRSGSD